MLRPLIDAVIVLGVFTSSNAVARAQTTGNVAEAEQDLKSGDFVEAEKILTALLAAHPNDADLLRRLAAAQAAAGHLPEANRTIDRALQIAPADHDIQLARANILLWRGQLLAARAQGAAISEQDPHYPGVAEFDAALVARVRADEPRIVAASVTGGLSDVSFPGGMKTTWSDQAASLSYAVTPTSTLTGSEELETRAQTDVRLAASINHRFTNSSLYLGVAATPDAHFREKWSVSGGGEAHFDKHWDLIGDVRYADYPGSRVGAIDPGLRYRPITALALTAQMINLFGGGKSYRTGGVLRVEYNLPHSAELYSSLASYPDTESDGTRQLRSASVGTIIPIYGKWAVRLSGDYEKRNDSYLRRGITLAFQWQFNQ